EVLSELANVSFGYPKHLGHFREGATGLKSRKASDDSAMITTVFLEDQLNHIVLGVVGEINVDVWQLVQRHAFFVQESAKIKVETNRAHATDPEAIANQAVRCATPRYPTDVAALAFL